MGRTRKGQLKGAGQGGGGLFTVGGISLKKGAKEV